MKTTKGFTLVELLVAVGIIGVLASVSLVSVNSIRGKARDSKRIADIKEVQNALEAYYSNNGYYPAANIASDPGVGSANFDAMCNNAAGFVKDTLAANCTTPIYMARVNENPKPARTGYKYTPTAGCNNVATLCDNYALYFELENPTGSLEKGCFEASPDGIIKKGAGDTDVACN